MTIVRMTDLDLAGKRVLIREDLNVPLKDGKVAAAQRLEAALPTLKRARDAGAKVLVMSHLGRPKEGVFEPSESLKPVADWLGHALGKPVRLVRDPDSRASPGIDGLYPVGEGAGYAGGIVSAAVDGLRTARAIVARYAPLEAN